MQQHYYLHKLCTLIMLTAVCSSQMKNYFVSSYAPLSTAGLLGMGSIGWKLYQAAPSLATEWSFNHVLNGWPSLNSNYWLNPSSVLLGATLLGGSWGLMRYLAINSKEKSVQWRSDGQENNDKQSQFENLIRTIHERTDNWMEQSQSGIEGKTYLTWDKEMYVLYRDVFICLINVFNESNIEIENKTSFYTKVNNFYSTLANIGSINTCSINTSGLFQKLHLILEKITLDEQFAKLFVEKMIPYIHIYLEKLRQYSDAQETVNSIKKRMQEITSQDQSDALKTITHIVGIESDVFKAIRQYKAAHNRILKIKFIFDFCMAYVLHIS